MANYTVYQMNLTRSTNPEKQSRLPRPRFEKIGDRLCLDCAMSLARGRVERFIADYGDGFAVTEGKETVKMIECTQPVPGVPDESWGLAVFVEPEF